MTTFERELKRGTLEMLLLHLLQAGPSYGYELVGRLRDVRGGGFDLKEGTLYPVLYRLESNGWVRPEWRHPDRGVPRKYYALTDAGRRHAGSLVDNWRGFRDRIDAVLDAPPEASLSESADVRDPTPPVLPTGGDPEETP